MSERSNWDDRPEADDAPFDQGLDLWALLFRRKWYVALGLVLGLALGFLYYSQQEPEFESEAQLFIKEKTAAVLPMDGIESQLRTEASVPDHPAVLTSPLIVGQALQAEELRDFAEHLSAEEQDPVEFVRENLKVSPIEDGSNVFVLKFRSPDPNVCASLLASIMDAYSQFLGDTQQSISKEIVALIEKARDELAPQLAEKQAKYNKFRQEAPLIWKDGSATHIHQERLMEIESERSKLSRDIVELEARIKALEPAISSGIGREALLLIIAQSDDSYRSLQSAVDLDSQLNDVDSNLYALRLEELALADRYGPDLPKLKSIRTRIQYAEQLREELKGNHVDRTNSTPTPPQQLLAQYVLALRTQLKSRQNELEGLNADFAKEEQEAKKLTKYLVAEQTLSNEILATQQLHDEVVQRLDEINIIREQGSYIIRELSSPKPGEQVAPSLLKTIFASAMLGLMFGGAFAYVIDRSDTKFHNPAEIGYFLRLPLVGHIPHLAVNGSNGHSRLAPSLWSVHHPKSPSAESFRAVRTALYFNTRGKEQQVIQVTSPTPKDGKSTLAANLAVTIARSGKRVLLLDADFRRPTLHKLFGLSMEVGLASVVDGKAEPAQAIKETEVANLYVMPCGPRPHNPSELLTSPQFKELLDLMRDQFDFVVVDTPPVLAVTDPSAVAARVDGVLLTLRIRKHGRPDAMRTRDILQDLGADILGVVVNGVGRKKGYGYDRGYGYRYGGGYNGYGESSNGHDIDGYYDTEDGGSRTEDGGWIEAPGD